MNTLILLGLSAVLAAEPSVPFNTSTSGSRQPLDVVLEQNAIGSEYGLDGNLLRLNPVGKWDPHPNGMAEGAYRWEGDPADYARAIRDLPDHFRVALTLVGEASVKEPSDRAHSVALLKHLRGATNVVEITLFAQKLSDADLAEVRDLPGLEVLNVNELPGPPIRPGETAIDSRTGKPWQWITDKGLAVLKNLPALTELTFTSSRISGVGLAGLTRLKSLTLTSTDLTDEGRKAIGQLAGLEQLVLWVTNDASLAHLAGLSKLRQLTLRSSRTVGSGITGSGLQHLAGLEDLRELILDNCYGITASGLESLAALKHLQRLDLRNTWSDARLPGETLDEIMAPVGRVTSLRELILPEQVGDAGLARIESLQNLRFLKMYSTRMTDNGLKSVGKMAALEDCSISGPELSDESLARLRSLRNLRRLLIGGVKGVTGPGLRYLPEIGRLESLHLPDVTGESLAVLPRLTNLRELDVHVRDDRAMGYVALCKHLEWLRCSANDIDDLGITELGNLTMLRYLDLIALQASDSGLASLGALSNLETLWLQAPGGGSRTMAAISRMRNLEVVYLVDVAMTDADAKELGALRNLRRLQISYTGENGPTDSPTDGALASLWDDLPELVIDGPRGLRAMKGQPLDFRASY